MSDVAEHGQRKTRLTNLALAASLLLIPVVYVLSYAPVYRWKPGKSPPTISLYLPEAPYELRIRVWQPLPFYHPVDLLIDKTPLREPLLCWADLFGVRPDFEQAAAVRLWDR